MKLRTRKGHEVPCHHCGKMIYISPARFLKNKYHHCSKRCLGETATNIYSRRVSRQCVICGTSIWYKQSDIKKIANPTCSYDCAAKVKSQRYKDIGNPKSQKLNDTERFFWTKAMAVQYSAKARGLKYDLDYKFLQQLYNSQNGRCYYSGLPMSFRSIDAKHGANYDVLSVDRMDSNKGYTKDNVVLALTCINMMKAHHDISDIRRVFRAIFINEQDNIKVKVKALYSDSQFPGQSHPGDAGYDLAVRHIEDCGNYIKIYSGIAIEPQIGYYFMLAPRSSVSQYGLIMYNGLGIIDNNYRGEIIGIFIKTPDYKGFLNIPAGARIMQLIPQRQIKLEPEWADELSVSERGNKGFGSTGK